MTGTAIPARVFASTYYDTNGYLLAQHGLTLRYRAERRSGRWQLKLPVDGARLEVEFVGRRHRPPESVQRLMSAHLRGDPLKPIATLRTRRKGIHLSEDGTLLADVTVDAVDVLRGGKAVRRFDEVEAELVEGNEKTLDQIEKILRKAGARKSDQRPKAFQALGVALPVSGITLSRTLPPIECLRVLMQAQTTQIVVRSIALRLGTDPEDVHQMRVATRRLRAFLRAARQMLAAEWAEELTEELAWLAGLLGRVRDLDVLMSGVCDAGTDLPPAEQGGLDRVRGVLGREQHARRAALLRTLRGRRYQALLERIEAAANAPVVADPDVSLEKIARVAFKKLCKTVRKGGEEPSDAVLHRIRIKGKRARHAAELAEAHRGKPAARFMRRVKELQNLLGEHHDAIVAERRLRRLLTASASRGTTVTLRRLITRQQERRREVRKKWPQTWAKVKKCGQAVW